MFFKSLTKLNQLNLQLLKMRVLSSENYLFSPTETQFYLLYTWSDSIFMNYLVKTQGIFRLTLNILLAFVTLVQRQVFGILPAQMLLDLSNSNESLIKTAIEKFYMRKVLFGSAINVSSLSLFYQSLLVKNRTKIILVKFKPKNNIPNKAELLAMFFGARRINLRSYKLNSLIRNNIIPKLNFNVDEKNNGGFPLFSPKSHFAFEHKTIFSSYAHPFHLVDPSPWPFTVAMGLLYITYNTVAFFHKFIASPFSLVFGIIYLAVMLAFWWRDVIRESTYEFKHTPYVRRGLLMGMLLFIVSEVMFFFGFFWAFFHASLVPSHFIGGVWPPLTIEVISPWQLPLVNTLCLLLSGVTLTIAHRQLNGLPYYNQTVSAQWPVVRRLILWMQVTIFLGVFFLSCQGLEYYLSPFTFQDTVFGGTFYILTGLHGMHVMVGTIFLIVCLWRASRLHFTLWKQVGFKSAVWYWHFVDVVWIFLFIVIYVWGGLSN